MTFARDKVVHGFPVVDEDGGAYTIELAKGVDDVKEMKEMADKHLKTVELYERRLGNIIPKQPATKKETKKDKVKKGDEPSCLGCCGEGYDAAEPHHTRLMGEVIHGAFVF